MVQIKEFMALYGLVDVKMRMLKISELKRIMGFPANYKLVGTQAEQKKFIGNAVEVTMARVICEALGRMILDFENAKHDMKSINLFGQEEHVFTNRRKSQKVFSTITRALWKNSIPRKRPTTAIRLQRCTTMFCNM